MSHRFHLVIASLFALVTPSLGAAEQVIAKANQGNPKIKAIHVISFAPNGVLLVGDGASSQIVAIETGDTKAGSGLKGDVNIANVDSEIAKRIGAKADGVEIIDLAVNPASGKAYLAVRKQDDRTPLIVVVDGAGEIQLLPLDDVKHAAIRLTAGDVKISAITDVAWADDRIVAAGRSNETFASKIFSVAAPLKHGVVSEMYSAETYHVSHRRWETKAPMSVVIPYKENDKTYVIGAFSCTPVVKYPLDAIQPGAEVKGSSVMELGSGNRPIDMFVYERDGKAYVLSNTYRFHHERRPFGPSPYWTVRFEQNILAENENVNENALLRLKNYKPATERVQMVESFHGVTQMDKLGNTHAVVLKDDGEGSVNLTVLSLP